MIKKILMLSLVLVTLFGVLGPMATHASSNRANKIKLAILAPDGSTWMNIMREFNEELKKRSKNEMEFKIYSGGVAGDEHDVIRKMRVGQMHAGGFTGVGLGRILPEIRVLELPFLFRNNAEVDYVSEKMRPQFVKNFAKKGYVFLGWAEAGFVNIFSIRPITSEADLQKSKMWAWEGDTLVKALAKAFKIVPVPLSITDVLTSLQTGLIDSFYAPPLAAIALQWFTKVKYITQPYLAKATGAMVITKRRYNRLSEKNKKILMSVSKKYSRKIVEATRKDNFSSYDVLKKNGLKEVWISKKELKVMAKTAKKIHTGLVGKLYSQETLDKVLNHLKAYRVKNAQKK